MSKRPTIPQGVQAPDFVLKDQEKHEVRLSSLKGKRVLLSFHPLAWTPVCAKQMKALERNTERFAELNTVALGISIDTIPSKYAWAKRLGIKETPLLSDFWPHGEVAKRYRIFRPEQGFSERANIVVDEEQRVVFKKIYDIPEFPDIEEVLDFLKAHKHM